MPTVAPTTAPTPTPTPQPTTVPAGIAQTWRILALVYTSADVTYTATDGGTRRFISTMTSGELATVQSVLASMPGTVSTWSGGTVAVTVDIRLVPTPLSSVTAYAGGFWVSPDNVRPDINTYAPRGSYDSVTAIWKSWNESGESIPVPGWGMSLMPGDWANGAGYATVYLPPASWWWNGTYPSEVFVHEWLHQAVHYYRGLGFPTIPSPDAATSYGYSADASNSWRSWLSALLTGTIADGSGSRLGIAPTTWALGRPSGS